MLLYDEYYGEGTLHKNICMECGTIWLRNLIINKSEQILERFEM